MRDSKEPAFELVLLPQVLQSFIDGNKRLLGEVAALFRVKSLAPKKAQNLSVVALKKTTEIVFDVSASFYVED
jgi:hypothetical protein